MLHPLRPWKLTPMLILLSTTLREVLLEVMGWELRMVSFHWSRMMISRWVLRQELLVLLMKEDP
jgi:hypothetical protein